MTYLTPEAQARLDEYLAGLRAALAGCHTVDPDEIEQDVCAHIAAEFPPSFGPVSKLDLEPVLARLGSPEQWVPAEERSPLGRAAEQVRHLGAAGVRAGQAAVERLLHLRAEGQRAGRVALERLRRLRGRTARLREAALAKLRLVPAAGRRAGHAAAEGLAHLGAGGRRVGESARGWLHQGPDDWRLAYVAFGLLALGLVIPPLLIVLLPASFCVARAAVARAAEIDEPLGARRWLIYPPLVLVGLLVLVPVLLWPILPGAGLAHELWRSHRDDFVTLVPFPRHATEVLVYVYFIAGALAAWLTVLGTVLWAAPRVAVAVFRPFADGFTRRQAGTLLLAGLGVLALCVGLAVRVLNSDTAPTFTHSANERGAYVVDVMRR